MKKILIFVLLVLTFTAIATTAQEFSADVATKAEGKIIKSKMFVSANKSRTEINTPEAGGKVIMITRQDKKVVWTILPGNMYMEQPVKPENIIATKEKVQGEVDRKLIGKDTVNGISCDKYLITTEAEGKKTAMFVWLDKDGFPVKMSDEKEKWVTEYSNIKKEKQPDALFEVPAGHTKFAMPKM